MSNFDLIAFLLVLTAAFSWFNHVVIKLPHTIGVLVMGLIASLLLIGLEFAVPTVSLYENLQQVLQRVDFRDALMNGMLAFLLFAGALHVDLSDLRDRAWAIGLMATAGVLISTMFVGTAIWLVSGFTSLPISYAWCLVFGALISPTDPVAVLSTLKQMQVPATLEADMAGESLFNDGIGVVIFTVFLAIASGQGDAGLFAAGKLFVVEALGGAALGLAAGFVAYRAMQAIDDYGIETLITLALVTGTYAVATRFHLSGPIAVVVAGILIGNRGAQHAMSDRTEQYVFGFWTLVDEMLNSVLFLLIGFEVLVLSLNPSYFWLAAAAIPITLTGRFLAVSIPMAALKGRLNFVDGTAQVMTWGGLRGGISIALALALPSGQYQPLLLTVTYAVVLFSIIVQGLTLGTVVKRSVG